jgi:tetratricopeptide (TPR) repeat protein
MTSERSLLRHLCLSASLCISMGFAAQAEVSSGPALIDNAGAYLAARFADRAQDFRAAALWYAQALEAQPEDQDLLQGLLIAEMSLGDFETAARSAETLRAAGSKTASVGLALVSVKAGAEDYAGIVLLLAEGQTLGGAVDDLVAGWAEYGQGQMAKALARFDAVIAVPGFEGLGLYQKALALASAGNLEGADALLSGPAAASIAGFRRGIVAHLQILSQLERNADALALFDRSFKGALDPDLIDLRRRLDAGEPIDFDVITSARQGIADALFTYGSAIGDQAEADVSLAYARAALYLSPDQTEIKLTVAEQLRGLGQFALSAEAYALVARDDPAYHAAEIGRADALNASGDTETAISVLQALAQSHGDIVQVQLALGDMLRRSERYAEALAAYDAGIALLPEPAPWAWPLYFNRGVCLERLDRFEEGIPSFRTALALSPNQASVLNYLGYTWIDRGENMEEGLALIEAAVNAAPNQGYIIDSLAWAYFRLGRYEEALAPMERASLLEPVDPILTDHLGDVYWVNGRQPEARFQWRRALSFDPDETEAVRIRLKLELGLDRVMEQEKAGQ